MKRLLCIVLSLTMLLLCGCESADPTTGDTRVQTEETTENVTETDVDVTEIQDPDVTIPRIEQETGGEAIEPDQTGCVRIEYTGNISSVRYITSAEDLPDHEALAAYDAAYFENKALVVVKESVSSGSIKVGIAAVEDGVVTLSHEMSGDVGTADMATWLLWAEVEANLDYEWTVANPALAPNTSTH